MKKLEKTGIKAADLEQHNPPITMSHDLIFLHFTMIHTLSRLEDFNSPIHSENEQNAALSGVICNLEGISHFI